MLPLGICAVARDERAKKEIARKDKSAKGFLGNTTTSSLGRISALDAGAGVSDGKVCSGYHWSQRLKRRSSLPILFARLKSPFFKTFPAAGCGSVSQVSAQRAHANPGHHAGRTRESFSSQQAFLPDLGFLSVDAALSLGLWRTNGASW